MEFKSFPKIPRYTKDIVITEKVDGTNAVLCKTPEGELLVGSRNRWITPDKDNYGFANWIENNKSVFMDYLPEGTYYGEWFGKGIQRGYGLDEKRLALFSLHNITDTVFNKFREIGVTAVPVLYRGANHNIMIEAVFNTLKKNGSIIVPGFKNPEGIIIYHTASRQMYKMTYDYEKGKWTEQ